MTRPLLHLTPPHGYLGDPNGLVERDGLLHAYYQWTPDATVFGLMHWGHAVSRDLVTWEHRGAALTPGDALDTDGCWSGSAAVGADGGWTGCLSLPRELVLDGDRVRLVPAAALRESVRRLPWDEGRAHACAEVVVETGPQGVLRLAGAGEELIVPVGALVDERETVQVVFDAGVVEVFGPLGADSATRLALPAISSAHADGGAVVVSRHVLAPASPR